MPNPYRAGRSAQNGEAPGAMTVLSPHPAYAVPDIPESTDPEYTDGFSPELRNSPNGAALPDDIRMGTREPPLNDPNVKRYLYRREGDRIVRQSDEQTSTGWDVQQRKVAGGQNPLWTQEREPIRPTAARSPLGYLFTRPWHRPRNIKDALGEEAVQHFSLADHRRVYPVNTMVPRSRLGVNTFRADPKPWDENLEVVGGQTVPSMSDPAATSSNVFGGNRSWRM